MSAARKFMFDLDFERPASLVDAAASKAAEKEPEVEEEEIVVPTFSEDDMAMSRQEGYEEGRRDALKESAEAVEREILIGLEKVAADLEKVFAAQTDANREIARDAIGIATAIARKMFPDLNARNALGEVERVVVETLKAITEEPRVQIMVHPELREPFSERLYALTHRAGFEGKVFVNADNSMDIGDCRVEWSNGAAVRDTGETWNLIDEIVERNLHGPGGRPEEEPAAEQPPSAQPTAAANERPAAPAPESSPESAPATASAPSAPAESTPAPDADAETTGAAETAPLASSAAPERSFAPSVTDTEEDGNINQNQMDMGGDGNPPIPSSEDPVADGAADGGADTPEDGEEQPFKMGDPVSPNMAGAILGAQEGDDDEGPDR